MAFRVDRRDMDFIIKEVLDIKKILSLEPFKDFSVLLTSITSVLENIYYKDLESNTKLNIRTTKAYLFSLRIKEEMNDHNTTLINYAFLLSFLTKKEIGQKPMWLKK